MRTSRTNSALLLLSFAFPAALAWSCAATDPRPSNDSAGSGGGPGSSSSATGGVGGADLGPTCAFPKSDVIDGSVPDEVVLAFDSASAGGGQPPQVYEPRQGAGLPSDWHSLYVLLRAEAAAWVEVTLVVGDAEVRYLAPLDAVASLKSDAWADLFVPHALWESVWCTAGDLALDVGWEIRTLADGETAPSAPATGSIRVLPLSIGADVTFWQIAKIGEQNTIARIKASSAKKQTVLDPNQTPTHPGSCIGCHSTTPDGQYVVYEASVGEGGGPPPLDGGPPDLDAGPPEGGGGGDGDEGWRIAVVHPTGSGKSETPAWLSSAAAALLDAECLERPSTTPAAWPADDSGAGRWVAASRCGGSGKGELAVLELDVEDAALHALARAGDPGYAAEPAWSAAGDFLVYTSTPEPSTGPSLSGGEADLYRIPLAPGASVFGGDAKSLAGAAEPGVLEFHPSVSADGALVAFTRAAEIGTGPTIGGYASGEIVLVPAEGGEPVAIVGHDDPELDDVYQGQLTNTWPRFTPEVTKSGSDAYYAIAFSSRRGPGVAAELGMAPYSRMFFVFVRRDAAGELTVWGPVLIPGQTFDVHNLTIDARGLTAVEPPPDLK